MYRFNFEKHLNCSCGWHGFESELEWTPFNPIDTFLGKDQRDNPNNIFSFKQICPKCRTGEQLKYNM